MRAGLSILAVLLAVGVGPALAKGRVPTGHPVSGVVAIVGADAPLNDPYQGQYCAGVLVRAREVLTAAHCVVHETPRTISVLVGGNNMCKGAAIDGAVVSIQSIAIHPRYDGLSGSYDLATLVLSEATNAKPRGIASSVSAGPATAYGWGRGANGAPACGLERILLSVPVQATCAEEFERSSRAFDHASMVCADGVAGGTNTCSGDSGGPLVEGLDPDGQAPVIGVVSWGLGCDGAGAYARAAGPPLPPRSP